MSADFSDASFFRGTHGYSLSINLSAYDTSPWYYTLVYPYPSSNEPHYFDLRFTIPDHTLAYAEYPAELHHRSTDLKHGVVSLDLSYHGAHSSLSTPLDHLKTRAPIGSTPTRPAKLALEYVAERSFDRSGLGFVGDDSATNPDVGLFSYEEALAKFGGVRSINGVDYSLPTRDEMASIFPPIGRPFGRESVGGTSHNGGGYTPAEFDERAIKRRFEQNIKIGATTSTYFAEYFLFSRSLGAYSYDTNIYAIRFQDTTDEHRTAFKYEYYDKVVKVSCVWLGASRHTMEDIVKPSFWADHASETVLRVFPVYGTSVDPLAPTSTLRFTGGGFYWFLHMDGGYWTSSSMGGKDQRGYAAYLWATADGSNLRPENLPLASILTRLMPHQYRLAVRPFIRN